MAVRSFGYPRTPSGLLCSKGWQLDAGSQAAGGGLAALASATMDFDPCLNKGCLPAQSLLRKTHWTMCPWLEDSSTCIPTLAWAMIRARIERERGKGRRIDAEDQTCTRSGRKNISEYIDEVRRKRRLNRMRRIRRSKQKEQHSASHLTLSRISRLLHPSGSSSFSPTLVFP